ncbi:cysteine--tRNA ligase [Candidatus Coxiella mudrowiae]|uniref:cysteine--tRNA ligase n=1 Tax=Candidatus Coxiella mudrowiae TaxID=2054173 RepID=UPI0012FE98EE|nr:cysteine--tRNA ligase [Candidatus Coxiella mudrowiae]
MTVKIFNSLTKKKEPLKLIEAGKVKLYVCGITVYDYSHIGHARSLITFDMVVRYLRMRGYEVTFIRNITDVDDKIIKRAQENKEKPEALAERFIQILHEDEKSLDVLAPDIEPRATLYIPEIIKLIEKLIDKQHAYIGENGDVYFDVRSFSEYGKLSHRNLDELHPGARVEISESKRNPLDFVLWKRAKLGKAQWKSPWGEGRPGWHIECSAMSSSLLGQPFDIHGGGLDLKFPHHENEIAQSEAAEEKKFVNLWMHTGLLEINKEKMSKSLGNIISIREVLETNDPEVLRYFLLSGHYRSPLSYSKENLGNSHTALERFYLAMRGLPITEDIETSEYTERFCEAMDDDFNTPIAFAILFEMIREINRLRDANQIEKARKLVTELKYLGNVFGLLNHSPEQFLQGTKTPSEIEKIEVLIATRNEARRNKDWKVSDDIRDQLVNLGIMIEDSLEGTSWRKEN